MAAAAPTTSPRTSPVVVVTGGSAGLGRAVVERYARRGWSVGILARGSDRLDETARTVERLGGRAATVSCDVADAQAVFEAAERIEHDLGPIEVWVNAAMVTVFSPISQMQPEEYQRITQVTYLGQVHGTLAALNHMRPRNRGRIVCIGSALGYRGIPLQSAYCASKFAVRGFFDSLCAELEHDGSRIRASIVQMPAMNTPQFDWARNRMDRAPQPVAPIFQPETCADSVVRAADEGLRELWVGPSTWKTVVGSVLAPGRLMDRLLAKETWSGQMDTAPADPHAPDNLRSPVAGSYGAHGRFDERSRDRALAVDPDLARKALGWGLLGALGLTLGALSGRSAWKHWR